MRPKPGLRYTDGTTRLIQPQDQIAKPSKEQLFFVMQQLRIFGEDV